MTRGGAVSVDLVPAAAGQVGGIVPLARLAVCWLLLLLLAGCAGMPGPDQAVAVDYGVLAKRYRLDQAARRDAPRHWGVEGILDLESPEQGRRNRVDLLGDSDARILLRAYGPFRQVARELLIAQNWMRLIDPEKRSVVQTPATPEGMAHLIGVPLAPERFHQLLTARAGPLVRGAGEGTTVKTGKGETLRLDPLWGRILERSGEAAPGMPYRAVYGWPEATTEHAAEKSPESGARPVMPERIVVTLEEPRVRLEFIGKRWFYPAAGPPALLFDEAPLPGFSLSRPLDAS